VEKQVIEIVVASRNLGKVHEISELLRNIPVRLVSLDAFPQAPEVIEDRETLEGNAIKKAVEVSQHTGKPAIADDTGLEVVSLGGRPGVWSARFAGIEANDAANRALLLSELQGVSKRTARFRTVAAYVDGDEVCVFEGICVGDIAETETGHGGFGYDSIFIPQGGSRTFAELTLREKNAVSHRGKAVAKLACFLRDRHAP